MSDEHPRENCEEYPGHKPWCDHFRNVNKCNCHPPQPGRDTWELDFVERFGIHGWMLGIDQLQGAVRYIRELLIDKCKSAYQHGKNDSRATLLQEIGEEIEGMKYDDGMAFNAALEEVLTLLELKKSQ